MKRRDFIRLSGGVVVAEAVGVFSASRAWAAGRAGAEEAAKVTAPEDCHVVWTTPSADSFGSMPLGNGDVGANVWVETNGDLVFYVSKVDAYDAAHRLRKIGRIRVRFTPALAVEDFEQTLVLEDGAIAIRAADVHLRVWVDANNPVLRVTGTSASPVEAVAGFETLRPCEERDDQADRLVWGYRNRSSEWMDRIRSQNTPEFAAAVTDPILNRTSGCRLSGAEFVRDGTRALRMKAARSVDLEVRVGSNCTPTLDEFFADLEKPVQSDWTAHQQWWRAFWERSHIFVTGCGAGPVNLEPCRFTQFPQGSLAYRGHDRIDSAVNAFQVSQRYALERFCEAAASRGRVPPPFNGSIFTMDMPAGSMGFNGPRGRPESADERDWAFLAFMWQNTRLPYWAMATRGDYDTLRPGMAFVREGLDVCRDRCQNVFQHEGAFIMEASWWKNVGVFNYSGVPEHLRYHFLAGIELPAMMCEYYEHTRDKKFLEEILLPCAREFTRFYELHFPQRDARGKMIMAPASVAETYQPVTNPNTEIGGLRFLLTKLAAFDDDPRWTKLLEILPDIPTRRVRGLDLLAVGDPYASGREICESPELYSVWPFRQAWLGTPGRLAMARQSYHVRTVSLDGTDDKQAVETGGWQTAPVQAAHLGLAREAARLMSMNFNDRFIAWNDNVDPDAPWPQRPRARFPAFWETKMDHTPDNDHGANSANTLQSMLLQSHGEKIHLLPAWPEDWDVSFKLCAQDRTTVECEYRGGKVRSLRVTPKARRRDVVDFSSREQRIRTLIEVACADRNHLFGLPPMLDGLPQPGPVIGAWLAKYGECFDRTKAGPWPLCLYRDQALYAFAFEGEPVIPDLPAKVVARKRLTTEGERPVTIFRLDYDQPLAGLALAAPSAGSLVQGRNGTVVDLGAPMTFDRLEFTIENPGYRRGQGKGFELQAQQADGSWRTVHAGRVFGCIYSKRFDPVMAQHVRLNLAAPLRQFDLFPPA